MVRTGRVLCITTPFILSVVALLCLIVILLAGTIENDKTTGGLYLYKVNPSTCISIFLTFGPQDRHHNPESAHQQYHSFHPKQRKE